MFSYMGVRSPASAIGTHRTVGYATPSQIRRNWPSNSVVGSVVPSRFSLQYCFVELVLIFLFFFQSTSGVSISFKS